MLLFLHTHHTPHTTHHTRSSFCFCFCFCPTLFFLSFTLCRRGGWDVILGCCVVVVVAGWRLLRWHREHVVVVLVLFIVLVRFLTLVRGTVAVAVANVVLVLNLVLLLVLVLVVVAIVATVSVAAVVVVFVVVVAIVATVIIPPPPGRRPSVHVQRQISLQHVRNYTRLSLFLLRVDEVQKLFHARREVDVFARVPILKTESKEERRGERRVGGYCYFCCCRNFADATLAPIAALVPVPTLPPATPTIQTPHNSTVVLELVLKHPHERINLNPFLRQFQSQDQNPQLALAEREPSFKAFLGRAWTREGHL